VLDVLYLRHTAVASVFMMQNALQSCVYDVDVGVDVASKDCSCFSYSSSHAFL